MHLLERSQHLTAIFQTLKRDQLYTQRSDLANFKLITDIIVVTVNCNIEGDPMKNRHNCNIEGDPMKNKDSGAFTTSQSMVQCG